MTHQNKDGSLANSPSATACALMHTRNSNCFKYLNSMFQDFGNEVPSFYPFNLFTRLSMIDRLERLGISRHFGKEIKHALDNVYLYWTRNEIIKEGQLSAMDIVNSSIAFRILRLHGYDVSPDVFSSYLKNGNFLQSVEKSGQAVTVMLNLYKASQVTFPGERILEEVEILSRDYLLERKADDSMHDQNVILKDLQGEVEYALNIPWCASLQRIGQRKYIEQYGQLREASRTFGILPGKNSNMNRRTAHSILFCNWIPCISNDLFLTLAKEDYNMCQEIQQKEMVELKRWLADVKIGDLNFSRQKLVAVSFTVAVTFFTPEMSAARMAWTRSATLVTTIDDFFDIWGSAEELTCFVKAVQRWDSTEINGHSDSLSRCQPSFEWYKALSSMNEEAERRRNGYIPSMEEYMETEEITLSLEPFLLPALYLVGPKLSEEIMHHPEYHQLNQILSKCGRLLNDIQSYKREIDHEGKLNSVTLTLQRNPTLSAKDVIGNIRKTIKEGTQQLLKKCVQHDDIPPDCKQLYWDLLRIHQLIYLSSDGFTSDIDMLDYINAVIFNLCC
ncbi:hypothetical protein SUGI_0190250 [Cryptomeria japonica]|nr:hypothetical protein SUGI_0190250 [Cryptomeria japonica]